MHIRNSDSGFALVAMMLLMTAMVTLLGTYVVLTRIELATTRYSRSSNKGFNSAEAGLNIRADEVRQIFVGFNVPQGDTPTSPGACASSGNMGSEDFACSDKTINDRTVTTYLEEDPTNPVLTTVPVGERYQNLQAQEYRYTANAVAKDSSDRVESMLGLRFKSRLIPLFQFAAFYNKDLEILPGPAMTLAGPVHTNGDLYLNANTSLKITGQVTTAGDFYRGRKNDSTCMSTPTSVNVLGTATYINLFPTCASRKLIRQTDINAYNGNIQIDVPSVSVPEPDTFDPVANKLYWAQADLRLVLRLSNTHAPVTTYATTGVEIRNADNSVDTTRTTTLNSATLCPGTIGTSPNNRVVGNSNTMYNHREHKTMRLLEVDMEGLINCIQNRAILDSSRTIYDDTGGGLVIFMTIDGLDSEENASASRYAVRVRNGADLKRGTQSNGLPYPQGVSVVSNQAAYIRGNYNSVAGEKVPAAFMVDSLNILSTNWNLNDSASAGAISGRVGANTTINSAFLAGTDTTGGVDGSGGQGGAYNGGLENYPRFHENWTNKTFTYRGSFVSLGKPRHVNGSWGAQSYNPPNRDWNYDTSFNSGDNLPPLTPRFVDLRQQLFLREYEQEE